MVSDAVRVRLGTHLRVPMYEADIASCLHGRSFPAVPELNRFLNDVLKPAPIDQQTASVYRLSGK